MKNKIIERRITRGKNVEEEQRDVFLNQYYGKLEKDIEILENKVLIPKTENDEK